MVESKRNLNSTSSEVLTMQPLFTRLTTPTPVITKITIKDCSSLINTPIMNQNYSRNSLKLDVKPVYTNTQIKNT